MEVHKLTKITRIYECILEDYCLNNNPNYRLEIGAVIKTILKELKISQKGFAAYFNKSPQNFQEFVSGDRKINVKFAYQIGTLLNIDPYLILACQIKNDIADYRKAHGKEYEKYNLADLMDN